MSDRSSGAGADLALKSGTSCCLVPLRRPRGGVTMAGSPSSVLLGQRFQGWGRPVLQHFVVFIDSPRSSGEILQMPGFRYLITVMRCASEISEMRAGETTTLTRPERRRKSCFGGERKAGPSSLRLIEGWLRGLEPPTFRATARLETRMNAWPSLPDLIRAGILAMVRAARG
jgi:hypothetical protein